MMNCRILLKEILFKSLIWEIFISLDILHNFNVLIAYAKKSKYYNYYILMTFKMIINVNMKTHISLNIYVFSRYLEEHYAKYSA